MVVAEDRRAPAVVGAEVVGARAEVDRGAERRVVDVLRVAHAVTVGVHAHDRPGRGDELHRADRAVVGRVVVVLAGVGVDDLGGAVGAVERDAVDAGRGQAVVVEDVAVGATVVGLDAADRGDQLPGQVAALVGGVDDRLGALVGRERGRRDAGGRGGGDDLGGVGAADAGGEQAAAGDARGRLDRLGGTLVPSGRVGSGLLTGRRQGRVDARQARGPGGRQQGQRHERGRLVQATEPLWRTSALSPLGCTRVDPSRRL